MKIKPKRIEIKELNDDNTNTIQDRDQQPITMIKTKHLQEVIKHHETTLKSINSIKSFFKKGATILTLFGSIVLVGSLYDAYVTLTSMFANSTSLALLYLSLIVAFVGVLSFSIFKNFIEYKKIKRVDNLQERGDALAKKSSNEVYSYAKDLINLYKKHQNSQIVEAATRLEKELETLLEDEVMDRLNELILYPLDKIAGDKITKYASQTAISTAISPVAFIDAILILSRSHVMIKEVANVYGFRPNWLGELHLIKRVFATLAFASATDILANHSSDFFGTSVLSKISLHSAQGIANGVLIARVGLGVVRSTRPTTYGLKTSGFFKTIYRSITKQLFSKNR